MPLSPAAYVFPLMLSAALSLLIFFMAISRSAPYRLPLAALSLLIVNWSLGYAMELFGGTIEEKLFWVKIQYFSIVGVPPLWLMLVLQYVGRERLVNMKTSLLLSIEPVITLILAWTNEFHHLIWSRVELLEKEPFSMLNLHYGVWAGVRMIYVYILISYSLFLLLYTSSSTFRLHRRYIYMMAVATIAPIMGNIVYTAKITHVDYTPIMFSITTAILAYGLTHHRIFDLMPVAKDVIIENMREGIIVVDSDYRIVKMNPPSKEFIGFDATGKKVDELDIYEKLAKYCETEEIVKEEMEMEKGGKKKFYEISVIPLFDRYKNKVGCMLSIYDITDIKKADEAMRNAYEEMKRALEKEKEFKLKTAHYFFNPLLIAKGYLEIASEKCHQEEIEKAKRAVERIEKVIKNIVTKGEIRE